MVRVCSCGTEVFVATESGVGARAVAAGRGAVGSDDAGSFYRPVVNETGNEVSCSVEETNKLRASLGLKPLKVRISWKFRLARIGDRHGRLCR